MNIWDQERRAELRRTGPRPKRPMPFLPHNSLSTPGEAETRQKLAAMPYQEYLRTPHWRRRRDRALWLAGDRCESCGARHGLQVHHRSYERIGWEDDFDLVVLCDGCHEDEHTNDGYRMALLDLIWAVGARFRVD